MCVSAYACRAAPGPERVGRAVHPAYSAAELQGDLICPSNVLENSEEPPLLSVLYFCHGFQSLCSLTGVFVKHEMSLPNGQLIVLALARLSRPSFLLLGGDCGISLPLWALVGWLQWESHQPAAEQVFGRTAQQCLLEEEVLFG